MLKDLSNCIRFLSVDMIEKAKSGHPGLPLGMADVITVLFKNHLKFNPKDPAWCERDRFVLSGGHGSALLYSILYLTGYEKPTLDDLKNFRQLNSPCAGHPEYGHLPGVETTTGPLGQGLGNAVGMAIAQKILQERYGLDYKIYVTVGDGDLMEGLSHEVGAFAGHLNLNNLIILFDDNAVTIDGPTSLSTSEDPLERFKAYGFDVLKIDGHSYDEIDMALTKARSSDKPIIISCKTIIGKGAPNKQGTCSVHGSPLGQDEIKAARELLNWKHEPFDIPSQLLQEWRSFYKKSEDLFKNTKQDCSNVHFLANFAEDLKQDYAKNSTAKATRILFQEVLDATVDRIPHLVGGSADLTPSNNTKAKKQRVIKAHDFKGSYLHYGIREHGMAAVMNGLSLSGLIPYGGTFLVFSDYMRPAIRLSALMKQQVIYIFTHDSIGLGEDGPTHQPLEHLCSLRIIPDLLVFRPCDGAEVAECWDIALNSKNTPSVFALSRQNLPYLRIQTSSQNLCSKGAYILDKENEDKKLDVTLIATGSEVHLCVEAKKQLLGHNVRIVSMPCVELFKKLSKDEQSSILGKASHHLVVEASLGISLKEALSSYNVDFIGMKGYGASAPIADLYNHFGITVEAIVKKVIEK